MLFFFEKSFRFVFFHTALARNVLILLIVRSTPAFYRLKLILKASTVVNKAWTWWFSVLVLITPVYIPLNSDAIVRFRDTCSFAFLCANSSVIGVLLGSGNATPLCTPLVVSLGSKAILSTFLCIFNNVAITALIELLTVRGIFRKRPFLRSGAGIFFSVFLGIFKHNLKLVRL